MSDHYLTAYDLVDAEAREAWVRERPASDYDPSDSCPRCGKDTFCDCEDTQ